MFTDPTSRSVSTAPDEERLGETRGDPGSDKWIHTTEIQGLDFCRCSIRGLYQHLHLGTGANFSGHYLMNRERVGVPLRRTLEDVFFRLSEPAVLVVDFVDVWEMTGSVAEEVGPKLFGTVENHRKVSREKYLICDNLTSDIRKELDAWFTKYSQCVPAFLRDGKDIRPVIGALPPRYLLDVLDFCYGHGPVTSSELERIVPAAAKKLTDIYRQYPWLLRRRRMSGDTPRSWRYQVMAITPLDRLAHEHGPEESIPFSKKAERTVHEDADSNGAME